MAKIYYKRIKQGKMTIEEVPSLWRKQVQILLAADQTAES